MASHATTHSHGEAHGQDHAHEHDHGGPKLYAIILGSLLVLTVITVAASRIDFGSTMLATIIALTIATVKASLVGLYFMHLKHDQPVNGVILVLSFVLVSLLIAFSVMDLENRDVVMPGSYKPPQGIETADFAKEKRSEAEHGSGAAKEVEHSESGGAKTTEAPKK
jgi:cytochrome c oxidase subunit IV